MSYPFRSWNRELHTGMTDGRFRKTAPNRGGVVEDTFRANREGLNPDLYDHILDEQNPKVLPDGSGSCTVS